MEAMSLLRGRLVAVVRSVSPTFALGVERILQDLVFTNHERIEGRHRGRPSIRSSESLFQYKNTASWFARGTLDGTYRRRSSVMDYSAMSAKRYFSFTPNKVNSTRFQSLRQGISAMITVGAFLKSSFLSLFVNYRSNAYEKTKESLQLFLKTSGLDKELAQALNSNMGVNLALLSRVQMEHWKNRFRLETPQPVEVLKDAQFWTESKRYMRYATAVYGKAMIRAADVEARGNFDLEHVGTLAVDTVSRHIGVPAKDIHLLDIDYQGDANHLRHFVAIDHKNEKVVLSIRGTFSPQEIMVDICAFSKDFCGGEAHSEMASMSERVWDKAGPTIVKLLNEHPTYELILTGHSLGAGTACLLTIMVQSKELVSAPTRCFAYASPPVFAPLEAYPHLGTITNFIHQHDMAPFLSVYSVRHLLSQLQIIQSYAYTKMSRLERFQVAVGQTPPPPAMMDHFKQWQPFSEPLRGAPCLRIPAAKTIWLHERVKHSYDWECVEHQDMLQNFSDLRIHPEMLTDHFAPGYEYAFEHLDVDTAENLSDVGNEESFTS